MTKRKKKILNGDTYTADSSGKVSSPPLNEAGRFLQIGVSSREVSRLSKTKKKKTKKRKINFSKGRALLGDKKRLTETPKTIERPFESPERLKGFLRAFWIYKK